MSDEQRERAIRRIREKRGFYWHAFAYVIVNAALVVIWATTVGWGAYFWPIWSILGWGIGLAAHAFSLFVGVRPITEDQIQREIDRGV